MSTVTLNQKVGSVTQLPDYNPSKSDLTVQGATPVPPTPELTEEDI